MIFDYRTFARYKAAYFKLEDEDGKVPRISTKAKGLFEKFCHVIKKHLARQKQSLFQNLVDSHLRQKYAWIIERKYDDWNLRNKGEMNMKGEITQKTIIKKV